MENIFFENLLISRGRGGNEKYLNSWGLICIEKTENSKKSRCVWGGGGQMRSGGGKPDGADLHLRLIEI